MLVLSRKAGESVRLGDEIRITVISSSAGHVRLGIDAPIQVGVHREEVYQRIAAENVQASPASRSPAESSPRVENRHPDPEQIPVPDVLEFEGLPGFPEARRFALVDDDHGAPFAWLVSLEFRELAFVVAPPAWFFPDYDPRPSAHQLRAIGADGLDDVELWATATLTEGAATLNLAGPILVHRRTRHAVQAILDDERYSTKELLPARGPKGGEQQTDPRLRL